MEISIINSKRQERSKLAEDAGKILAQAQTEKRDLSGEETQEFNRLHEAAEKLKKDIDLLERQLSLEQEVNERRDTGIGRETRTPGETRVQKVEERQLEAWRSFIINGVDEMPNDLQAEMRSLSLSGTSGYTAPDAVSKAYIDVLRDFTDIRQAPITVIPTTSGNSIPFPTFDDTANSGDITAEAADSGAASDPTVAQIVLSSYMITTGVLKVTRQFLRDSAFPAEQWLNQKLGERLGAKQNALFTSGTGSSQPKGIVIASAEGVTLATGHATALGAGTTIADKAADLVSSLNDLVHSVKKPYRQKGKTGFMFNDNTAKHIKTYVDANGRTLWQPGLSAGDPDTLLGWPIWINDDMEDIAAGKKPMIFGNFSYYYVRDVGSVAVDRLMERYGEYLMVGFLGYHAVDANLMDTAAVKYLKNSAS